MNEIILPSEEDTQLPVNASMAAMLQKAEIDQLISTARAFPRSLKRVRNNILSMATLDEETAEECIYALPRGGKPIKGASIRFAEILKQVYGNCRSAARVIHVDRVEGYVEAEGVFHDLETNTASTARVRRRVTDKRGKLFTDDMIIVTGNAACSIAMRNAILAGVPKPLWRHAYDAVQATITGDVKTLSENREKAFKALAAFGATPEQICKALDVVEVEDITVDHIGILRGMYSALKNGEATFEEMFSGTIKKTSDHEKIENALSDEPVKPEKDKPDTDANPPVGTVTEDGVSGTDTVLDQSEDFPSQSAAAWLTDFAAVMFRGIGDGVEYLDNLYDDLFTEDLPEVTHQKSDEIISLCKQVCNKEIKLEEARKQIALIAGISEKELEA